MTTSRLDRLAQIATILGAVVTAASVVFGVLTFRRTANEQRQSMALGLLQEYLKLSVEHPDLASLESGEPLDIRHAWFATNAIFTSQAVWKMVGSDPRWERIIRAMVRDHENYLQRGALACEEYDPEFIKYVAKNVPALKCAESGDLR